VLGMWILFLALFSSAFIDISKCSNISYLELIVSRNIMANYTYTLS